MKFRTILADPPWEFRTRTIAGRDKSPDRHYPVMTIDDIAALPVAAVAAEHCVLLFWTTWAHLAEGSAHAVIRGWGFQGKTGFPWLKLSKQMLPRMGTGFHARACTEPLIVATKGSPPCPEPWERMEGAMFSKLGPHSAKPDDIYERAELYDGPYLELFARPDGGLFPPRSGWIQVGNEITGRDIRDDLRLLSEVSK